MSEAFVPRGGFEGEQRTHVGNLELAHVSSEKSSSDNLISLYEVRNSLNNAVHVCRASPVVREKPMRNSNVERLLLKLLGPEKTESLFTTLTFPTALIDW